MGGDLRDYFPHLPPPPKELPRLWRCELIRVGFWIMWPCGCYMPACRLIDRLRRS